MSERATTSNLAALDAELNKMILEGKTMEAFEKFYHDDCSMQENHDAPTVGKDKNRERELAFFATVEEFHGATLTGAAVGDDISFSEWEFEVTYKGSGRVKSAQVARRTWHGGKVIAERFYHK